MTNRSAARHQMARLAALAVALLLVSALAASGAAVGLGAAQTGGDAPGNDTREGDIPESNDFESDAPGAVSAPPTRCFAGDGYPISIGETGATIDAVVHLSVLTDPAAGNEFGLEAAGTLDGDPIVTLAAGVRLTAREAISNGIDPFAAFDVLYAYELDLPMFGGAIGDSEYRGEGSPIESSAGTATC
ncbi:DUF7332 family protein [Halorubrum depositum]|uniref:DUF7332 family protein n=1 Tax=Halorubrum depositum TaxID=2583992 RepID=UPI0011A6D998|nr:hypothetical protein [Halorubrum depositum]